MNLIEMSNDLIQNQVAGVSFESKYYPSDAN